MTMAIAYLSFGSNLGNRFRNFEDARFILDGFAIRTVRLSQVYEAEPFCYHAEDKDQPWFLNQVAEVEMDYSPMALFLLCKEVESRLGSDTSSILENGKRRYFPDRK